MSKFWKKLVLAALVISMLGCEVQPLFSYAVEQTDGVTAVSSSEQENAETQQTAAPAAEDTSKEESTEHESAKVPESGKTEESTDTSESGKTEESTDTSESGKTEESTDTSESGKTEESTDTSESGKAEESKDTSESAKSEESKKTEESTEKETSKAAESEQSKETKSAETKKQVLEDGTWKVLSGTDDYMFHIAQDAEGNKYSILVVDGDKMTVTITLTGVGYDYLYMGTKEEADAAPKSDWVPFKEINGYYTYTLEISKLDKNLTIASHSKRLNQWYQHTIIFYSKKAVALSLKKDQNNSDKKSDSSKDVTPIAIVPKKKNTDTGTGKTSGTQKKFKNDKKADKVSKYKDDSNKSTSSVDNGTTLKDGVYTPDGFSWSGGSGRLAYIRCNKLTVSGGKVLATIEFGSDSYDQCKASGNIYYKNGSGLSTFVIPVELNKNNTIIARTTAMSSPHWVKYSIYIAKATGSDGATATKTDKKVTEKLSKEAPSILGLETKEDAETAEVIAAKYFQIFSYADGVKLIQIDMNSDTYMEKVRAKEEAAAKKAAKKASKTKKSTTTEATQETEADVEYDEEGKAIAKSQTEITEELYQNKVVNYLVVPKDVEIPAGLDKTYILIQQPTDKTFAAGKRILNYLNKLNKLSSVTTLAFDKKQIEYKQLKKALKEDKLSLVGKLNNLDYKEFVLGKTNLALLPSGTLPDEIDTSKKAKLSVKEQTAKAKAVEAQYISLTTRFTALGIPVLVDRSGDEETKVAKAEWIKVYGIIYGCEDEADAWFENYVKKNGTKEEIKALTGSTSADEQ